MKKPRPSSPTPKGQQRMLFSTGVGALSFVLASLPLLLLVNNLTEVLGSPLVLLGVWAVESWFIYGAWLLHPVVAKRLTEELRIKDQLKILVLIPAYPFMSPDSFWRKKSR